jgi:hypothetical protein
MQIFFIFAADILAASSSDFIVKAEQLFWLFINIDNNIYILLFFHCSSCTLLKTEKLLNKGKPVIIAIFFPSSLYIELNKNKQREFIGHAHQSKIELIYYIFTVTPFFIRH